MKLSRLLGSETTRPPGAAAVEVTGLTPDSRTVRPGDLFAALPGTRTDGAEFIPAALAAGARAVLVDEGVSVPEGITVPVIRAKDPRRALALIAAEYYRQQPETIVAVTGTNGKTSTTSFVRQIWANLGLKAANLGTLGLVKPDGSVVESLTTPEPVTLHRLLAEIAQGGVTHLAMEASSHGLEQRRLDGVKLAAGAYLNIGHDHLDYHKSEDDYFNVKLRLFDTLLSADAAAVINADGERAGEVVDAAYARGVRVMTVGTKGKSLRLESIDRDGFAQRLTVWHEGERHQVRLPLVGSYIASNALVAAGLAIATGTPPEGAFASLEQLKGVTGRLEIVAEAKGGLVVVDYAHKPEALDAALDALRPFVTGKLICVFGCGGDRDRGKRPVMGRISTAKANITIVTDDNPRTEDAASIRKEILAGAPGAIEIGDRAQAIAHAVGLMGRGDVVLIAGKGHETYQIIGETKHHFSDHEEAAKALAAERDRG
jgi:UDP-N-acetylmuramoyl-L-alanyl-D-glutamate--2,6-diaminopimelate ligase